MCVLISARTHMHKYVYKIYTIKKNYAIRRTLRYSQTLHMAGETFYSLAVSHARWLLFSQVLEGTC